MNKYKIYIGFDPTEREAYDVARKSFIKRASEPKKVYIRPIELEHMKFLTRPISRTTAIDGTVKLFCPISKAPMATEFAISRFAIPFLEKRGWVLFVDSDVVCLADVKEIFELADEKYAVMVVKHNQESGPDTKMGGQVQTYYSRKNWSSVVLWNLDHESNKKLTVEMLNTLPGRELHAFCWLTDEEIGELPAEWNHLVDVNPPVERAKILHYTLGGPWIKNWVPKESDHIWNTEFKYLKIKSE